MKARRIGWAAALLLACQTPGPAPDPVGQVDLDRYAGRWYEIASFPHRFQRGCVATTARYTRVDAQRLRVENECRNESFDGDLRRVEGVAWLSEPGGAQGKLYVRFFWPFRGDYWIIDLDPDYRFAAVGHPSRDHLWILSRTPQLDPDLYRALLDRVAAQGYDLDRLEKTPQPESP